MNRAPTSKFTPTQIGILLLAAAIFLGLFPRIAGIGWSWSLVMVVLGVALWRREARQPLSFHPALNSVWLGPLFAVLAFVQTWQILDPSFIALLWVAGTTFVCVDLIKKSGSEGWSNLFDIKKLSHGWGLYLPIGAALCFLSLLMLWGRTPSLVSMSWTGGNTLVNQYNPYTGNLDLVLQYQPMLYPNSWFYPGFTFSGRSRPFAEWAEIALLLLLAWSAFRRRDTVPQSRDRFYSLSLMGFLALWWLNAASGLTGGMVAGPLLFFIGLAAINFGIYGILSGRSAGRFAPEQIYEHGRNALHNRRK